MKQTILIFMLLATAACGRVAAQNSDRDCIRLGNKYFREQNFSKAETYYRKALEQNQTLEAYYNLGNALTFQQNDSLAFDSFGKALGQPTDTPEKRAWVYHNMGNLSYLNGRQLMKANSPDATKAFAQAVECYKSALRCNPDDNETRYNLAMAQYMLKQNQYQNQQNQDQNQQNQDQNQQNQDQQQNQQQDQQQNQQQDQQQNQQQDQQQNQQQDQQQNQQQNQQDQQNARQQQADEQRGQMDDRTAEQLLNSALQDVKGVQRKVQKAEKAHRRGLERDW
ncbi:MAG: tetratricopeptide repeat protein [Bacteroidaceae bacterium]|nr:tetratricopeptide repeat protein [Bacteroidaceae bacterium]